MLVAKQMRPLTGSVILLAVSHSAEFVTSRI